MKLSLIKLLFLLCATKTTARDNRGKEFVLSFSFNYGGSTNMFTSLYVSTSDACTIRVECPSENINTTYALSAQSVRGLHFDHVLSRMPRYTAIDRRAIRISSDKDVSVYGLNSAIASTDGFLALPTSVFGERYIVGSYAPHGTLNNFIRVASGINNAHVAVKLQYQGTASVLYQGSTFRSGDWLNVTLNELEVLGVLISGTDITGTEIYSDSPVSVFAGSECASVPSGCCCDHLVEQFPPANTLGKEYITSPIATRIGGDYFRIVASEDNTTAVANGVAYNLNRGDYQTVDVPSTQQWVITADKPILLLQYCKSQHVDGRNADPFMTIVSPTAQYASEYLFSTPDSSSYFASYISIIIFSNMTSGLRLDGQPMIATWNAVPSLPYSVTSVPISSAQHHVYHTNPTVTFALYTYGFANIDSYGYTGGARFAPIAAPCVPSPSQPADGLDNDCDGRIDEELVNGIDDDGDGVIDEDIAALPPQLTLPPNVTQSLCATNTSTLVTGVATQTSFGICINNVTSTYVDSSSGVRDCGEVVNRTWKAVDGCGQTVTGLQQIINSIPYNVSFPSNIAVSSASSNTAPSSTGYPVALSECYLPNTTYTDTLSFDSLYRASINRTWTVTAPCGSLSAVQIITLPGAVSVTTLMTTTGQTTADPQTTGPQTTAGTQTTASPQATTTSQTAPTGGVTQTTAATSHLLLGHGGEDCDKGQFWQGLLAGGGAGLLLCGLVTAAFLFALLKRRKKKQKEKPKKEKREKRAENQLFRPALPPIHPTVVHRPQSGMRAVHVAPPTVERKTEEGDVAYLDEGMIYRRVKPRNNCSVM